MAKPKYPKTREPIRWARDFGRVAYALGIIKDDSKSECLKLRRMVDQGIAARRCRQIGRGRFELI